MSSEVGRKKDDDEDDIKPPPAKIRKNNSKDEDIDKQDVTIKSKKKHKKESKKSKHKDKKHKHKHKHKHDKEKSKEKGPKHEVTIISEDSDQSEDDTIPSSQTVSTEEVKVISHISAKITSSDLIVSGDDSVKDSNSASVSNTTEPTSSQTASDQSNEQHISTFNVDLKEIELPPDKVNSDKISKEGYENGKVSHDVKGGKSDPSKLRDCDDQKKEMSGNLHSTLQLPDMVDLASIPKPVMPHPNDTIDTPAIPLPKAKESVKKKSSRKVTENKASTIQATLRESMMKEVQKDNCDMPQSIVDDMFKDFLASKMQQIEEEYNKMSERFAACGSSDMEAEIASSVNEMNKLLDAELDSISQNVKEYSENYRKSQTKDQDHVKSEDKESEKGSESSSVKPTDPKVKLGTKAPGKMQLQFKITQSSAKIISSGQQFDKDGNKKDPLEEGEVSSEDDDSKSDDDGDSESEGEADNDEVSGTGSLSDSDKEGGTKAKKKKKKNKKKKSKKKHKSSKEKQTQKTDEKSDKKKRSRSRSQSRSSRYGSSSDKSRRRSRSRSRSRDRSRKSSYYVYDAYDYRDRKQGSYSEKYRSDKGRDVDRRRSRSRSRGRKRRGSRSRSKERRTSRSKSRERPFRVSDLRLKIDKSKLREIAIKNALALAKSGHVQNVDVATLKSGGKSINELTDFCKRISSKSKRDESSSSDEEMSVKSDDDEFIHHPFKVKDASSIVMNIRDSKPLPIQTPQEKLQQQAQLRLTFPVSSGSTHRMKESEWVPVEKTTATATKPSSTAAVATTGSTAIITTTTTTPATPAVTAPLPVPPLPEPPPLPSVKPEDKVFPDPPQQSLDISAIISERLSAFKKLQQNPHDLDAMKNIAKAQEKASIWAQSKHLPGKFIGSTGAHILTQEELMGPDKKRQAWAKKIKKRKETFHKKYSTEVVKKLLLRSLNRRYYKPLKDQFVRAAPVKSGIGMALLQKMGWREGEGLGKNNEGNLEPLSLDFKTDRKGLTSMGENVKKVQAGKVSVVKDLSGKHPVSALVELCNKRRWGAPDFQLIHESGPDHKKNFLYKVIVHNVAYQPAVASNTKKVAKAAAATACLQELGLVPR